MVMLNNYHFPIPLYSTCTVWREPRGHKDGGLKEEKAREKGEKMEGGREKVALRGRVGDACERERYECVRGRMKSDAVNKLIIGQSRWPSR